MGGGAFGPNLTGGDVDQQFPPPLYDDDFFGWISAGVPAFEAYGTRGISSGRMPHFGAVLTKDADRGHHGIRAEPVGRRAAPLRLRAPAQGAVVPDDPRRARGRRRDRALLRLDLRAARHQPRRAPRFPRRVHRAHGVHGDPQPALVHHRVAAQHDQGADPAMAGAGSGRDPGGLQDRGRPRHPEEGEPRRSHRGGEREGGRRRRARPQGGHADRAARVPTTTSSRSTSSPTSRSTRSSTRSRSVAATRSSGSCSSPTIRSTRWRSSARSSRADADRPSVLAAASARVQP